MKLLDKDGNEVEAFMPDEVQAQVSAAVSAKEAEYKPKMEALETELTGAKTALGARAGEFAQFRRLTEEQASKLSVTERALYENQVALQEEREKNVTSEKNRIEAMVDSTIRAKAGTDENLVKKMKDMWSVFGIEANNAEQIENKSRMILGAISVSEPDLVATVNGFSGGSFMPPAKPGSEEKSFADTERGKSIAGELGLKLETPKQ